MTAVHHSYAAPTVTTPLFDGSDEDDESIIRDRSFNPWRFASSEKSKAIINEAIRFVENYEKRRQPRKRKRRANDQQSLEMIVEAVLCDLMHHRLYKRTAGVYVSRSNRFIGSKSRYRPRPYTKAFPCILDMLGTPDLGWIVQTVGDAETFIGAKRTVITAGPRLISRMDDAGLTSIDLGIDDHSDPIVLKREKADFWDDGGAIEYVDDVLTDVLRKQMDDINTWLLKANLDVAVSDRNAAPDVDLGDRKLRRIFTRASFTSGGRLFGGFWQGMSKADRKDRLYIDDELCIELDYGQMAVRILYGVVGIDPGCMDLYTLSGLEDYRSGVKTVFNAMLFSPKKLVRMPKGTRAVFPSGVSIGDVTAAIETRHPDIKHFFHIGYGHAAQFTESEILVDLLFRLMEAGITALPIHDAVLVSPRVAKDARQIMLDTFHDKVGISGQVDVQVPISYLH